MRHALRILLVASCCSLPAWLPAAPREPAGALPATRVLNLHYGDVLFRYFTGEDFEALTRLEAYSQQRLMPDHGAEAALLAGGLYLQLGMHNEAARRFGELADADLPRSVRDRAWFYLGEVWYARGYHEQAVQALQRIEGTLSPALEAQRRHLLANALIRLSRYDEAIALLSTWETRSSWALYARFNLGVALLRSDRLADAAPLLEAVGQADADGEELRSLKDRANLALAYAWLQAGEAATALPLLGRVRLDGPQSSRALLALGWARSALGQYREALSPWLVLRERNLLDAAVQESFLAVPYAFAELGANGQAAEYYEQALAAYGAESARIDEAVARIRSGALLAGLVGADDARSSQSGWFWQLQALPDAPESRYLYPVLAGHDFQEGLKNFRDLAFLGTTLGRWDENMAVYADMIDARERAHEARTPRLDALLAQDGVAALEARRQRVEGRYNAVVASRDVAALGSAAQRRQWQQVEELEAAIAADPGNPDLAAMQDKLRLVRGVLQWDLERDFRSRLAKQQRDLRVLDRAMGEAAERWLRVQRARAQAEEQTSDFSARIAALQARLTALRARLGQASDAQRDLLADIAVGELAAQKQRIADYEVQARFALATIYDRAAEPVR